MAFEQTRDLVRKMHECRKDLGSTYAKMEPSTQNERLRMMLMYLKGHEERLAECLEEMAHTAPLFIMNTWFKFVPLEELHPRLGELALTADMAPDDLARAAIELDACMLTLLDRTAKEAPAAAVSTFFMDMLAVARQEHMKLVEAMRTFD